MKKTQAKNFNATHCSPLLAPSQTTPSNHTFFLTNFVGGVRGGADYFGALFQMRVMHAAIWLAVLLIVFLAWAGKLPRKCTTNCVVILDLDIVGAGLITVLLLSHCQPPCWTERAAGLLTAGKGHHHYAKTLLYACVYYVYMYHNPIDHNMFYRNMVHIHMRITKFLHSAWPSVPDLASVIQACYTQCIPGHHSLLTKPLSLVAVKVLSKDHATHDKS